MRWLAVAGLVVIAGCAEKPVEEMGYSELSALASDIEQRCTGMGLTPGTPQHQQCKQVEAQKEITTRRASQVRQRNAAIAMGAGMQQASRGYYAAANRQPVTCTTSPAIGWGSATTTCR